MSDNHLKLWYQIQSIVQKYSILYTKLLHLFFA